LGFAEYLKEQGKRVGERKKLEKKRVVGKEREKKK
jgi:hypothetical protein